jgi:hypothetical protein
MFVFSCIYLSGYLEPREFNSQVKSISVFEILLKVLIWIPNRIQFIKMTKNTNQMVSSLICSRYGKIVK